MCVSAACTFLCSHRVSDQLLRRLVPVLYMLLTRTHRPLSILAHSHTRTGLLEFEVLQQLDAVCELRVSLQASSPLPCQPFRKRPSSRRTGDGIHRDCRLVRELHDECVVNGRFVWRFAQSPPALHLQFLSCRHQILSGTSVVDCASGRIAGRAARAGIHPP